MIDRKVKLINNFINGKYKIINLNNSNYTYKFYINSIDELKDLNISRLDYKSILENINNSIYIDEYLKLIKNIEFDKLYKSSIHGINHNIRVSLLALIISVHENISLEDFRIVIEAAKYHDIGRKNDLEDKEHGLISSQNLDFLNNKYSEEEMKYLKTIIQCHSLNDNLFEEIATKNKIDNIERCRKIFNILKDSDGLDRARLGWPLIKIEFIRTNTAKKLIPFAYELFESYNYNLEVIEDE